jgi:alkanesulfonate monooxygenase SsuD/methylene tetrahydromethanopterin reductase-like flavin-dependent oxidoreductase (luciferase family)
MNPNMRQGIIVNAGDPRTMADLAAEAEAAGWDGVFYWDGIAIGAMEIYDPWVVLAAMAMRTQRVRLGLVVSAPARQRPWKLARETMTLDHLSSGRLVLPVGLGALDDAGFGNVGEPTEARTRAELLDETLAILDGLWSGQPFGFEGRHYRFGPMTFRPTPIQQPRIPIWVVGAWPNERSMRRALRWDGIVTQVADPNDVRSIAEHVRRERPEERRGEPFEIVAQGSTPADPAAAAKIVRPWAEAGATWWIDADWDTPSLESLRRRIAAGPPTLSGFRSSPGSDLPRNAGSDPARDPAR